MKAEFENICRKSQKKLKKYVKNKLMETHEDVTIGDGFVYAQGKFPVLLVAHMDTVHENLPTTIVHDGDIISSPNGIGGDDRCGIYMILEIIKKYHCSVLFCEWYQQLNFLNAYEEREKNVVHDNGRPRGYFLSI